MPLVPAEAFERFGFAFLYVIVKNVLEGAIPNLSVLIKLVGSKD